MKKKIINGIMMVALVVATSTSFVSCKDTNEDVRVEQAIEIAGLQGRLKTLENQYGDLDGRVSAMKNRLDEVETRSKKNEADIAGLNTEVDLIEEEIGQLELWLIETFAKLVTSVEISGTYNNMLGSINVPGFEPKMLIFNYGVATREGTFPKTVNVENPLEWKENDKFGAGKYNPGNAGFIYANVNRYLDLPLLTKDQDAKSFFDFKLVNTAGEEVKGITIVNTDKGGGATTEALQWGWTRADNNIFKFGVTYLGDEASNFTPAKIDLSKFKDDLKQVWADRNRYSGTSKQALGHLVADLYYNLATKDTNMKKYALKISWADNTVYKYEKDAEDAEDDYADIVPSDESTGLKHMVTSEAELVFASVSPLAFNSGKDLVPAVNAKVKSVNNLIDKMEPYMDKILNKIKSQVKIKNLDERIFYNGTIAIADGTGNVPAGHYILTISGTDLDTATGQAAGTCQNLEIDIDNIVNPIKGAYENVNDMMDDLKSLLAKVNGTNIGNWMEKFTNRFNTLFANNASQMLQPVLLAVTEDGTVNRVSGMKEAPYVVAGEVTLKPTTYTAELFAPCYAKFVGCKDIKEDNFNQILFSGDQELKFTPDPGKVYEIVYEAVDFFGNIVDHTYYIQGGRK